MAAHSAPEPAIEDTTKTYALNLDDMHNIIAAMRAGLETMANNLEMVKAAKIMGLDLASVGIPDEMIDTDKGVKYYTSMKDTLHNIMSIHNAMEDGENIQIVSVPF